ncbi:MAG: hypothetical protein ABIZ49_05775 [Opitutaceae bacterium]
MKTLAALVLGLSLIAARGAQTQPGRIDLKIPSDNEAPKAASKDPKKDTKAVPEKEASVGQKKEEPKKEEAPGKIEGLAISRGERGSLGIRIVDGVFRLTFYDLKKKPRAPDVARAVLRWPVNYKTGDERTVLNPGGDAFSFTSPKVVRPPFTFKLYITLIATEAAESAEPAGETYVVDFRQQ